MAIEFDCPYCTTSIRVPDAANGKKGKCPRCEKIVRVPKIEIPAAPPPPVEHAAPPKPSPPTSPDAAPPRPEWLGGSSEPPPADPSGFVEAAPDGPPDFSAFDADEDETRQLDRSELERSSPATADEIGAIPVFGEEPVVASGGPVGAGTQPSGPKPGKRVVRRRRRKKLPVPPWAIPVACVVVMGGLLAWWMFRQQPKLEGELKAEGVYFLMPLAAGRFRVEGREIDGRIVFGGEYLVDDVTEIAGELPADYRDPWLQDSNGGPDPAPLDEAPPLSGGSGTAP